MALSGRSNGGLLVGATMTMRPDLAKVAFPGVGVLDMLRTPLQQEQVGLMITAQQTIVRKCLINAKSYHQL